MFGYIRINKMDLTFREYDYYKGYYCGLCKYLKENHGEISRLSLNYDITFLIVILTALYKIESKVTEERCIANPLKKKMSCNIPLVTPINTLLSLVFTKE